MKILLKISSLSHKVLKMCIYKIYMYIKCIYIYTHTYNLLLKKLFKFHIQVSYFIDEATQAQRHRILNFMKWNIFRNLQNFHHSTSKRHYFGGCYF